jgi:hypothetical protein
MYSSKFGRTEKSVKARTGDLKQQYNNWWENYRAVNVTG